jgi:hypothetical protein
VQAVLFFIAKFVAHQRAQPAMQRADAALAGQFDAPTKSVSVAMVARIRTPFIFSSSKLIEIIRLPKPRIQQSGEYIRPIAGEIHGRLCQQTKGRPKARVAQSANLSEDGGGAPAKPTLGASL